MFVCFFFLQRRYLCLTVYGISIIVVEVKYDINLRLNIIDNKLSTNLGKYDTGNKKILIFYLKNIIILLLIL